MDIAPLITKDELQELSDAVVLDVRWYLDGRDGYESYLQGHYRGAVFVDLETVASQPGPPTAGRHPLPPPTQFIESVAKLGVAATSKVVVIDDACGSIAARIWWMLDSLGVEAYVLLGGVQSLPADNLCLSPCQPGPTAPWAASVSAWPEDKILDTTDIEQRSSKYILLDARTEERYLGLQEPIDRVGGHIPGARSLPWQLALDSIERDSRDDAPTEIRALLEDERELVAYCGSGVTACAIVLALRAFGREVKLYPESYSGWSSDPSHPICAASCKG